MPTRSYQPIKSILRPLETRLFFSDDREPQNFRGHRSVEGFVRYAQRMTGPAVRQMTWEELQKAMVHCLGLLQ